MRGGKCRSLTNIIYGLIILVRFIFEVIIISVPRDECVPLIFTPPIATLFVLLPSDVIFFLKIVIFEVTYHNISSK